MAVIGEEASLPLDGGVDSRQLRCGRAGRRHEREETPLVALAGTRERRAFARIAKPDECLDAGAHRRSGALRAMRGTTGAQHERGDDEDRRRSPLADCRHEEGG